jgi:hypothetical protein
MYADDFLQDAEPDEAFKTVAARSAVPTVIRLVELSGNELIEVDVFFEHLKEFGLAFLKRRTHVRVSV